MRTATTLRYRIYCRDQKQCAWIYCGEGDTRNGCMADIPREVLEEADSGGTGIVNASGDEWRIDRIGTPAFSREVAS
jgi:hypothetical protein